MESGGPVADLELMESMFPVTDNRLINGRCGPSGRSRLCGKWNPVEIGRAHV